MNLKIQILLIIILSFSISAISYSQEPWSLQKCVDYALENNIQIKQSKLNTEYNENLLNQSKSNRLPNLNASIGHGISFGQALDPTTYEFTQDQTVNSVNPGINSTITVFNGFQLKNTIERNRFNLLSSIQDHEKLKNDISLNIAAQYLQILFNEELLNVAKEQLEVTSAQVNRSSILVNAGSVAKGDLLQIQAQEAADELTVISAENNLQLSYLTLSQLLELDSSEDFKIVIPEIKSISEEQLLETVEQIFPEALEILPQIKGADNKLKSAEKSLDIAKGSQMPRISISGSYGSGYSDSRQRIILPGPTYEDYPFLDQLSDYRSFSIYTTLSIPIFNNFSAKNGIKNARINVENYTLEVENQKNILYKEIQQAYADALAALKQYRASEKALVSMEEAFKYTREKYEVGLLNAVDFNIAQSQLVLTRSELLRAKYDYIFKTSILHFYKGEPLSISSNN
ncbi:MAG: TolC family protein [Bacteroidales bacterium]|nr:TolC family protein [Bacteroidales bacterium]MCF8391953.1 TolC family protein [Bacteroidales bacterium]